MKRAFWLAAAWAALCALPAAAQQTYSSGPMQFIRGGHNQWGAPGEFGQLDWQAVSDPQSIFFGLGDIELGTGAEIGFNITGKAGLAVRVIGRNGTITATYPMGVTLTYPDPRTVHPGDTFTISSSYTRLPGGSLSTSAPDFAMRLSGILTAQVSLNAHVELLGEDIVNEDFFTAGPYDLSTSIVDTDYPGFKQVIDKTSGNFSVLDGLLTGTWGFPQVKTSGGDGPGNTLISSGVGDFLTLQASITNIILFLFGAPPFEGFQSYEDGDIQCEFHVLDLFIQNDNGIRQDFTLTPKPKAFLQLSNGQTVSFNVGDNVTLTMPGSSPGSATNDLVITPSFTMDADVHNHSSIHFGTGLKFNPLYGHLKIDFHGIGFEKGLGFDDIDLIDPLGFDIDLMDKTFTMEGFNTVTGSAFTVEGYRYPAPTLSSVSPILVKLNSGALSLTANGTGFVDAYTNGSGTVVGTTVLWDGSPRTTTYFNSQQVVGAVTAADTAVEGRHSVTVSNPSPGGGTSNALTVIVDGTPPVIAASANPATLPKGGNPNQLISVTVSGSITDALSGVDPFSATYKVTDEYNQINPSGAVTLNPDGTYSFVLRLSNTIQKGDKDGRHYTIEIDAKDKLGNAAAKTITVVAPS